MNTLALAKLMATLILTLLTINTAFAHKSSDSYIVLIAGEKPTLSWDIALRDLEIVLGLDNNGDNNITWGEVQEHQNDILNEAHKSLQLYSDKGACQLQALPMAIADRTDGKYAALSFAVDCQGAAPTSIDYTFLFSSDPQHRGLLSLQQGEQISTVVLAPNSTHYAWTTAGASQWNTIRDYVTEGVGHIWIGYDHIGFLLALLLPAVLRRENRRWEPVALLRTATFNIAKVVTAFTIAHSITLSLAVLGIIELPSRLVESAIAASVALAALNIFIPLFSEQRWLFAFVFGLVHGFGFASVLADLGLPSSALATALVSFNVGVELGQLSIVAAFIPLAFILRKKPIYRRFAMPAGATAILLLGSTWFIERAFNIALIS